MQALSDCSYRLREQALHKKDIKDLLEDLRHAEHFYYALLIHASLRNFSITVEDAFHRFSERLTIEDFLTSYPRYHPRLAICSIQYRMYRFRKDWDEHAPGWRDYIPTYDGVELGGCWERSEWPALYEDLPRILAHTQREAMHKNKPFTLTSETVTEYGFTPEDVAQLGPVITACHRELQAELRADYERLAALDCIHQKP